MEVGGGGGDDSSAMELDATAMMELDGAGCDGDDVVDDGGGGDDDSSQVPSTNLFISFNLCRRWW